MKYIVIELQTTGRDTAHLFDAYDDRNAAESKFHTILAAAAISQVEVHSAVLMTEEGFLLKAEHYDHREVENATA